LLQNEAQGEDAPEARVHVMFEDTCSGSRKSRPVRSRPLGGDGFDVRETVCGQGKVIEAVNWSERRHDRRRMSK